MEQANTSDKTWCRAPSSGFSQSGVITGVWLGPNEEVEWSWVHAPNGSYVNGYIVKNKLRAAEVKAEEKGKI